MGQREASHGPGHADREMTAVVELFGVLAALVQEHLGVGRQGSLFPEVEGRGTSVRKADHHEATASDVSRCRMYDGKRETRCDSGVYGVPPGVQHRAADLTRDAVGGHDHAPVGPDLRGNRRNWGFGDGPLGRRRRR